MKFLFLDLLAFAGLSLITHGGAEGGRGGRGRSHGWANLATRLSWQSGGRRSRGWRLGVKLILQPTHQFLESGVLALEVQIADGACMVSREFGNRVTIPDPAGGKSFPKIRGRICRPT
jgi:hypothetical protein